MVTFLGRGSRLAFPFQPRDRHGCRTRLSRPTCAPRATSSRVDNLFEPRREIRGGDPPRIPPTARSLPGCSRDPWIRHPAEGVRHPRQVGPDRPSARVTVSKPNANRVRVLPLARHRRHASRGRALPRPQVRTAPTTPRGSRLPPPRVGVSARQIKSSSRRAELDARRARDWRHRRTIRESRSITRLSGEEPRARSPGRTTRADALTPLPHSALRSRPGPRATN